jgi:prepilin-type N-terminal cleavage/methylation domain-containing protein
MFSENGTTLLELILVMLIVAILAGFVSQVIFSEINVYNLIISRTEALQNSQRVLQRMSREIRQIMAPDSIFQASADSLRFDILNDVMISYKFTNNRILRNDDLLMNSTDTFQFTYFDNSGSALTSPVANPADIRSIALTVTALIKGQSFTVQTKVTPRNF